MNKFQLAALAASPLVLLVTGFSTDVKAEEVTDNFQLKLDTEEFIAQAVDSDAEILNQLNDYSKEGSNNNINQVTDVDQLRDVSPGDWAYEALRSLVNRYGCIVGYPNLTYRGNRALSRYEFAAGLNACMNVMERLIANSEAVLREDIDKLKRLVSEFEAELATLGARVDDLEGRVAFLEDHQFSTTTKLEGEVVFGIADVFGGEEVFVNGTAFPRDSLDGNQTVFQDRVRLSFVTSFTGKDALYTRLDAGNATFFNTDRGGIDLDQGTFTYSFDNGNDVEIGWLAYYFPIGDDIQVYLPAAYPLWQDFVPTVSPYLEGFTGASNALTSFGESSPIYKIGLASGGGIGINYTPSDAFTFSIGYFGGDTFDPSEKNGLFNGEYSALAQITWTPNDKFQAAVTYVNAYFPGDDTRIFDTGVGTFRANNLPGALQTNSIGAQVSYQFSSKFAINGFFGYTDVSDETDRNPDQEIYYYGVGLAFPDLGKEGNLGGLIVGVEPYLSEEEDAPLHIEGFYKYKVNDNISVTPGVIWLPSPFGRDDNDDAVIGVVRTTFTF